MRAEVVGAPTGMRSGKSMRAWIRRADETFQREAVREAWQKVRIVRAAA